MTIEDEHTISSGVDALRRVASLIRQSSQIAEPERALLILRDLEGLAHRLKETTESEWNLGNAFAFLSPQEIGVVVVATEPLLVPGAAKVNCPRSRGHVAKLHAARTRQG